MSSCHAQGCAKQCPKKNADYLWMCALSFLFFTKQTQCQYFCQFKFTCLCAHSHCHVSPIKNYYLHFSDPHTPHPYFYTSRAFTPHIDPFCIYTCHIYLVVRHLYMATLYVSKVCVSHTLNLSLFLSLSLSLSPFISLYLFLSFSLSLSLSLSLCLCVSLSIHLCLPLSLSLSLSVGYCRTCPHFSPLHFAHSRSCGVLAGAVLCFSLPSLIHG